ncbi:MAG: CsbD family protein [Ardenticatenaceae bacterium]|nr:CsbD family protein [Ardenticatenaceae bacterium]
MTFNRDYFEGKWQKTRGLVRQRWAELTNDDLEKLQGRYEQFVGLLQEKYGYTRDKAEHEIQNWLDEVETGAETAVARLDTTIKNKRWQALATTLMAGFAFGVWVGLNMESSS